MKKKVMKAAKINGSIQNGNQQQKVDLEDRLMEDLFEIDEDAPALSDVSSPESNQNIEDYSDIDLDDENESVLDNSEQQNEQEEESDLEDEEEEEEEDDDDASQEAESEEIKEIHIAQIQETVANDLKNLEELKESFYIEENSKRIDITDEHILQLVDQDRDQLQKLISENKKGFISVLEKIKSIERFSNNDKISFKDGISFLNAQNDIMLSYLTGLHIYLLYQNEGISIKGSQIIQKLIYQKTLLSQLGPIEKKLEYQINQLMRISLKEAGNRNQAPQTTKLSDDEDENMLSYKPRPELLGDDNNQNSQQLHSRIDDLLDDDDDDNDDDENDDQGDQSDDDDEGEGEMDEKQRKMREKKILYQQRLAGKLKEKEGTENKKYVAPKLSAALSKEDKAQERLTKQEERRKVFLKRKLANSMMSDFDTENPLEQQMNQKNNDYIDQKEKQRERFELDNFMRLPETKKDKRRKKEIEKKRTQLERIDDTSEFDNIRDLLGMEKMAPKNERQRNFSETQKGKFLKSQKGQKLMAKQKQKHFQK